MDPKASNSPPTSYTSFPILAIAILGILTTAVLLLSYYLFVIKCCLHWRRPLLLLRFPSPHRSRRLPRRHPHPPFPSEPRGLDPSTINSIPTLRFAKSAASASAPEECAVCLADFRENELLRLLPACSHSFHIDCIDVWLQFNPNCPLCRNDISLLPILLHLQHQLRPLPASGQQNPSVVIDVRDETSSASELNAASTPRPATPKAGSSSSKSSTTRRFWQMASMGDECIDTREKDERFEVQPLRRSFSMDSSHDRQLYVSVQDILRQNPNLFRDVRSNGEGSSGVGGGANASGRIRRSFFSFGRSSRNAASVLPVQREEAAVMNL